MIVLKARVHFLLFNPTVHFLLFNPTDKRAAITYVDGAGIMQRVSKGAPEQVQI